MKVSSAGEEREGGDHSSPRTAPALCPLLKGLQPEGVCFSFFLEKDEPPPCGWCIGEKNLKAFNKVAISHMDYLHLI